MALITPQTNLQTRLAIQKSAAKVLRNLTPNRLVQYTDGQFVSADPLTNYITGTANEINVADDGDGTITISIVDPLIVGKGGTGVGTLTEGGLLLGSGTGAITPLAQATNGQLPIGSTGADPILAGLTGTANQITVTNGVGSITLSAPQDIHTGASPAFAGLTLTGTLVSDAVNISTDTTTGTQIGTGATQKLGFFGSTPVVQQTYTTISNPPTQTEVTAIRDAFVNLGFMAAS